uniref:Kelch domain-containing protein 4 n=1 Tax=Lygus hesperus TaxID=30085 RepID=A0A0A9WEH8_LYGHE
MGKNQKKKGKGAEKTAVKTEKKLNQKMKKQLKLTGEEDIEAILAEIEKEEQKRAQVVKKEIAAPTRRVYASLTPHPYKDELLLFGGEFYNGKETSLFNDLFIYKIATNEWTLFKIPGSPPPRTSHQAVAVPSKKGEMWVFGGEFSTKSESQFYHYKDLWVLHLDNLSWERVMAGNGPSSRSGHRMVLCKRQILLFGGYHDNLRECKYYNDVYAFNLDDRVWHKLEPSGTAPCPRSGCQMAVTPEGKIVIWGGYSKSKVKKDLEAGVSYADMYLLSPEKGDTTGLKWKWSVVKPGGMKYGARSGVSAAFFGNYAYTFGGSVDNETEEDMTAEFFNELHSLDLQKLVWSKIVLTGKKEADKTKPRRRLKDDEEEMAVDEPQDPVPEEPKETIVEDGVFTMKIGPAPVKGPDGEATNASTSGLPSHPHARINTSMAIKGSKLYIYGGLFEDDDRQHTLPDFHSIDVKKFDEWKTLIECDLEGQEWIESSESEGSDSCDTSEEDISMGSEEEEED